MQVISCQHAVSMEIMLKGSLDIIVSDGLRLFWSILDGLSG